MKTAISLSDELFESAEKLAKRLGISRSELYATALAELVAKHLGSGITSRLDQVYSGEEGRMDTRLRRAQGKSVRKATTNVLW